MNRNLKISLLGLGSMAAVAAPVALAVSCGDDATNSEWVLPEYQQRNGLGGHFDVSDGTFDVGLELAYAPYNFAITSEQFATIEAQANSETDITTDNGLTHDQAVQYMEMIAPAGTDAYGAGFDVYVANQVAKGLGSNVKVMLHATVWDSLIPDLTIRNNLDAIIAGMTATEERNEVVGFSESYLNASNIILYANGTPVPTFESLRNTTKKIAVQTGTTQATLAERLFGMNKLIELPTANDVELQVQSGRSEFAICEDVRANIAIALHPELHQVTGIEQIQQPGAGNNIAIPGNTPVSTMTAINSALALFTNEQRSEVLETAAQFAVYVDQV